MPKLIDRIATAVRVLREGIDPATGLGIDVDDDLYRRLSGRTRDLNPVAQERAQSIALYLWRQNPMARRVTEMMVDFVVGDGIAIGATDEKVAEVLQEFWADPRMNLELRHRDWVRDLGLYGEIALRPFTNEVSGRTRLGYVDQARIRAVEKDPEDAMVDLTLIVRGKVAQPDEKLAIVNLAETDPTAPVFRGDAFYFAINRTTVGTRGTPDLLALADWVDGLDQILWNVVDRSGLTNAFVWDVTIDGADPEAVAEWIKTHGTAPRPGTVRVHNEREKWEAVAPALGTAETDIAARLVKNYALGGAGIPEGWFAEGGSTNRATLSEQGDPTYRMLQARQDYVRVMFETILRYVGERAIEAGRLPAGVEVKPIVTMPDVSTKDTKGIAGILPQLANALMGAITDELISVGSARRIFLVMAGQLGVELDPDEELQAIEDEAAAAAKEKADNPPSIPALDGPPDPNDPNPGVSPGPGQPAPAVAPTGSQSA